MHHHLGCSADHFVRTQIFFVGHILSCFWFLAGEDEYDSNGELLKEGWITGQGMRLGDDVNRFDQYLHSMYWAMTTMTTVGYGDISATVRYLP